MPATITVYDKDEVDALVVQKYSKPASGVPKADLEAAVQTSLGKADSALQAMPADSFFWRAWTGTAWQARGTDPRPCVFTGGTSATPPPDGRDNDVWLFA